MMTVTPTIPSGPVRIGQFVGMRLARRRRSRHVGRRARLLTALAALLLCTACQATSAPGLNIRARPTTASPVVANIARADTPVRVVCSTRGTDVNGNDIWYRISNPRSGYVTSYYIRASGHTTDTARPC
jgi:hypothetical protein